MIEWLTSSPFKEWAAAASAFMAVFGVVMLIWKVLLPLVKRTKKLFDSLARFSDDWFGEPSAPGRDPVPGVMERLNKIDGELKHNGGSTMKDAIKRVETSVEEVKATQQELKKNQDIIVSWMTNIDGRMDRLEKGVQHD